MTRELDPGELRRLFPPLVGSEFVVHQAEKTVPALFPSTDRPGEQRICVSLTLVGTQPEDVPDLVFGLTLAQAEEMRDNLTYLLNRAEGS